jgi:hypothetical protein
MILLVTASERARECAGALQEAIGEEILVAESLSRAATLLRSECYTVVVLDQYLLETEPHEVETVVEHCGTAIAVQVNFAISGMERLVREVRAAMQRRQGDEVRARHAATAWLASELNGTVTALLLSTELALETPALPSAAAEKIESVHELVKKLWQQLESANTAEETDHAKAVPR